MFGKNANNLWLANNSDTLWQGPVSLALAGTIQNSQCSVNAGASSFSASGNQVTVNLSISFQPSFSGSRNVYLRAVDAGGLESGWQVLGAWTVVTAANAAPSAVSVAPNAGSGTSQSFQFVLSDPNGNTDISKVFIVINSVLSGRNACSFQFRPLTNNLWLANDPDTLWLGPVGLGTSATLQNTQCSVSAAASSFVGSGNNLTVTLSITFQSAFSGNRNIYLLAEDAAGLHSGWQTVGTWNIPLAANVAPAAVSVTPNTGSGTSQTFQILASDGNGFAHITRMFVIFNSVLSGRNACSFQFRPLTNNLWLANDPDTLWLGPVALGAAGTVQNSQCGLNAATSSFVGSGNNLTVNLAITFQPAFSGLRNIYVYVEDTGGLNSGWQVLGAWSVAGASNVAPTVVSVTPNSGSGATQTFQYLASDQNGSNDISKVFGIFNSVLSGTAACSFQFRPATNQFWLANDNDTLWLGPIALGSGGTVQNSQCTINASGSSFVGSGNNLTLNVSVSFKPAFAGSRKIYLVAEDASGAHSGWQQLGTWTVN